MVKDTDGLSQESVDIPVIETQQLNTENLRRAQNILEGSYDSHPFEFGEVKIDAEAKGTYCKGNGMFYVKRVWSNGRQFSCNWERKDLRLKGDAVFKSSGRGINKRWVGTWQAADNTVGSWTLFPNFERRRTSKYANVRQGVDGIWTAKKIIKGEIFVASHKNEDIAAQMLNSKLREAGFESLNPEADAIRVNANMTRTFRFHDTSISGSSAVEKSFMRTQNMMQQLTAGTLATQNMMRETFKVAHRIGKQTVQHSKRITNLEGIIRDHLKVEIPHYDEITYGNLTQVSQAAVSSPDPDFKIKGSHVEESFPDLT